MNRTGWAKVPSATTGGKPFFYYHRALQLWVVWNREHKAWVVSSRSARIIKFGRQSLFPTPAKAAIAAEKQ